MAKGPGIIRRFIQIIFDKASAQKAEQEMASALGGAGKKAGENFVRELREAFERRMAELKVKLAAGIIDQKEFKKQSQLAAKAFNDGIVKGMKEAHKAGTLTDKEFIKLSKTLKRTGDEGATAGARIRTAFVRLGAAIAATFSIRAITGFLRSSIEAALEAEESYNRLNAVLEPLGLNYRAVSGEVEKYLDRIQATTRFSDEDAREALANLVSATGDYEKSLKLLDLTANIAEKRHTTMADAAKTAALASLGLSRGMLDLGISTHETGDLVQKLELRLGNLAEEAGGSSNSGKIARAANLWNDFKEELGAAILGANGLQRAGGDLTQTLIDLNKWIKENKGSISEWASQTIDSVRQIVNAINFVRKILQFPAKLLVSGAELLGIPTDRAKKEAHETVSAVTDIVVTGQAVIRKLTQDEQHLLHQITEDGGASLENLTKQQLAAIHRLEKEAASGRIILAMHQTEAIERILKQEVSARRSAQKAAIREAEALRKRFAESRADITQEIADLQRLAIAHGQGTEAVAALTQVLKSEADVRKVVKDMTADQAKELTDLIKIRDQERETVDFLSRSGDIKQDIVDFKRLAEVQDEGVEAIEAVEEQLRLEADIRRAVAGLTGEHADAIARLVRERQKEQAAIKAGQETANQQQFLQELGREGDAVIRMKEAQRQGAQAVAELTRQLAIEEAVLQSGALAGSDFAQQVATLAALNYDAAQGFATPWIDAMQTIRNEVEGQGTLFAELGQAWAEGGFKGIIELAKHKVKENLAFVIENLAKAFGSFALGNPASATLHLKAAAQHGVAAVAWKALAATGGGSSGASGAGGSVGSSSASAASRLERPESAINIYLTGPGWNALNPEVQRVVSQAGELARERYGANSKVRIIRGSR